MGYNNYRFSRAEANYIEKITSDPNAKRNSKLDKAIAKRIQRWHKTIDWNKK